MPIAHFLQSKIYVIVLPIGAALISLGACSSTTSSRGQDQPTPASVNEQLQVDTPILFPDLPRTPAIARLEQRAAGTDAHPATPVAVKLSWIPESQHIGPQEYDDANASLDSVLEPIRQQPLFVDPIDQTATPSEEDQSAALRLYARGRLASASDDKTEALSLLEHASRLDPTSPEIFRAFGNAQLASGLRSSGMRSLQRAAQLGLDDVRIWAMIGLEAVRRRDEVNGIRWLVAARDQLDSNADPVAVSWIELSLGELLMNQKRLRAGAELIESALTRPVPDSSRSSFRAEYATLIRRRPQLWLRVGDAHALLGQWTRATNAYNHANAEATDEIAPLVMTRQVAVLLASGQRARAALTLLDRIRADGGTVTSDAFALLRQISVEEQDLAPAIAELTGQLDALTTSQKSRLLLAQLAATHGPVSLDDLPPGVSLQTSHAVEILRRVGTDDERWRLARELVERNEQDAAAVADALFAGGLIAGNQLFTLSSGVDVLSLRVRLRMGLPNRSSEIYAARADDEQTLALIETAAETGHWQQSIELARSLATAGGLINGKALAAAHMPTPAFEVLRETLLSTTNVDTLLFGARLALEAGQADDAADVILRATDLDPYDPRPYSVVVQLLQSPDPPAAREALEDAIRSMRETVPWSDVFESLAIGQILGQGFIAEAQARQQSLLDRLPSPTVADYSVLLDLWKKARDQGDESALDKAQEWLERNLDATRPAESRAVVLARLMAMRTDPLSADQFLKNLPLAPTPTLIETRAQFLRNAGHEVEAATLIRSLYEHDTLSIGDTLRLAALNFEQTGTIASALDRLEQVPRQIELLSQDRAALANLGNQLLAGMLGQGSTIGTDSALGLEFASFVSFALDHNASLPEPYHRVRLRALAQSNQTPVDDLIDATAQMHEDLGQVSQATFEDVFTQLAQRERTRDAFLWAGATIVLDDVLDENRWASIAGPLATIGSVETTELVLDRLAEHDMLEQAVKVLLPEQVDQTQLDADPKAEAAYLLAGIAASQDLSPQAMALYQLALRFQPDHAWASNDYGYMLVDRNERLDEAERLLRNAISALPDQPNVLDSLAWLRYRQGRFSEPSTGQGAIELLERAIDSIEGSASATMNDHLGDTLWMLGRDEEAHDAWARAESLYLQRVRSFNTPDMRRLDAYARQQALLGLVREKLRALEIEGVDPPVADSLGTRIEPIDENESKEEPLPTPEQPER